MHIPWNHPFHRAKNLGLVKSPTTLTFNRSWTGSNQIFPHELHRCNRAALLRRSTICLLRTLVVQGPKGVREDCGTDDFLGRSAKLYDIVNCWFIELGDSHQPNSNLGFTSQIKNNYQQRTTISKRLVNISHLIPRRMMILSPHQNLGWY